MRKDVGFEIVVLAVSLAALATAPIAHAQGEQGQEGASWKLGTLESGKYYPTSVAATNLCPGTHTFKLRFEGGVSRFIWIPDALIEGVATGETKITPAVVDLRAAPAGSYQGTLITACTDCSALCTEDFPVITISLGVTVPPLQAPSPPHVPHLSHLPPSEIQSDDPENVTVFNDDGSVTTTRTTEEVEYIEPSSSSVNPGPGYALSRVSITNTVEQSVTVHADGRTSSATKAIVEWEAAAGNQAGDHEWKKDVVTTRTTRTTDLAGNTTTRTTYLYQRIEEFEPEVWNPTDPYDYPPERYVWPGDTRTTTTDAAGNTTTTTVGGDFTTTTDAQGVTTTRGPSSISVTTTFANNGNTTTVVSDPDGTPKTTTTRDAGGATITKETSLPLGPNGQPDPEFYGPLAQQHRDTAGMAFRTAQGEHENATTARESAQTWLEIAEESRRIGDEEAAERAEARAQRALERAEQAETAAEEAAERAVEFEQQAAEFETLSVGPSTMTGASSAGGGPLTGAEPDGDDPRDTEENPMICGPDVTLHVLGALDGMINDYGNATPVQKELACRNLISVDTAEYAWDMVPLAPPYYDAEEGPSPDMTYWLEDVAEACAIPRHWPCGPTVEFLGQCMHSQVLNYIQWGVMNKLCDQEGYGGLAHWARARGGRSAHYEAQRVMTFVGREFVALTQLNQADPTHYGNDLDYYTPEKILERKGEVVKDSFDGQIEAAGSVWTSRQAAACLPICLLSADEQETLSDRLWQAYVWEGLRDVETESVPRRTVIPDEIPPR